MGKADFERFIPRVLNIVPQQTTTAPADHYGVIILGGGMAGWAVAEAVRSLDEASPLLMVTACSGDRYHKPELSVAISKGADAAAIVKKGGAEAAAELNVSLLPKTFVLNIDSRLKQIRTTRGAFSYDKLVFATGATPLLPDVLPPQYCWRVNHLDGFDGLQKALAARSQQRVLIIGGGMIGTELAEDICRAGHQVSVIDRADYPLAGLLPESAARLLADSLQAQGIRYCGGRKVSGVSLAADGSYRISSIDTDGIAYADSADQIVAATGLKIESRLPERAGLDFHPTSGIRVNPATLQTNREDIYALGDCIDLNGKPCRFIAPLNRQADTIAAEITGQPHAPYAHDEPVVRLKTKSLSVVVSGSPDRNADWATAADNDHGLCLQQTRGGEITAEIRITRPAA
ncbi:MAG: FAD-dependent oxidoreductase [Neisseria sp.]|nr:FAD-dependent oxidoreductase [Neisseria sp.]